MRTPGPERAQLSDRLDGRCRCARTAELKSSRVTFHVERPPDRVPKRRDRTPSPAEPTFEPRATDLPRRGPRPPRAGDQRIPRDDATERYHHGRRGSSPGVSRIVPRGTTSHLTRQLPRPAATRTDRPVRQNYRAALRASVAPRAGRFTALALMAPKTSRSQPTTHGSTGPEQRGPTHRR
jgi:hypothetical protein